MYIKYIVTMDKEVLVRYNLDEFMKYKKINDVLPIELENICSSNNRSLNIRNDLQNDLNNIIVSTLNGIDPNDILLKTTIRDILNKICVGNYDKSIENLKSLKYMNSDHFGILAREIIDRSMNDPVAYKGFTPTDTDNYISNVNASVAKEFTQFCIETYDNKKIKFRDILTSICRTQYVDFIDDTKKLDANNKHRSDNYKGFMNLLGLLYTKNILSTKIIITCLLGIKKLIFESDWSELECENLYSGYERLCNQLIFNVEITECRDSDLLKALYRVTESFKTENNNNKKLRRICMLSYENLFEKITNLYEKYI
jgi:hypothetical protein